MPRANLSDAIEIVAIDDEPSVLDFVAESLAEPGLTVRTFSDPLEGWEFIQHSRPAIVILDQNMPGLGGMELLERIVEFDPGIDVVLLTGEYSTDLAVEAIQKGAGDYLTKPIGPAALRERVAPFLAATKKRLQLKAMEEVLLGISRFGEMIGNSVPMLEVYALVRRIAPHFRSVLITGETGTGKELVARSLHQSSPLKTRPFVICNCAAIVESLFESELFGHVRGAYTGATQDRAGMFEAADGGTLFLDEIGEVPLPMQAKFLRALQSGEIQRVGSSLPRRVNVRIIAATNRDLRAMVKTKDFREDLFYRLSMLEIRLPSLAERREDLPLLCRHFIEHFARERGAEVKGITLRAQKLLSRYGWPGNVRELENVIGHAATMTMSGQIDIGDLPEYIRSRNLLDERRERLTLAEVERRHVRSVLEHAGGNKHVAAEILGISRATLYRYLHEPESDQPD